MMPLHTWNFFRAGGVDQVRLESGADLLALNELDQKLWVALSCPTRGIEFDTRTLDMIDADGDGYVRANEVLGAVNWAAALLKNAESLAKGTDQLLLSDIADRTEEGRQILASARHILASAGKGDATEISLEDMANIGQFLASLQFNGDGVICAGQIADSGLRAAIEDIVAVSGTVADRSGDNGVNQEITAKFFADAREYIAWHARGEADAAIFPLGADSLAAAKALQAVKAKIDDYFTRCQLAAYDPRAASPLSRAVEDYQQLAAQSLSTENPDMALFPLAAVAADKALPLVSGINPAWRAKIEALRVCVVRPLLGEKHGITEAEWLALCAKFSAFGEWQNTRPASPVGELGIERLREMVDREFQAKIGSLIAQDQALEPEIKAIYAVERLIRYQRDLLRLANNFVSFSEFYSGKTKAVFQFGVLYMDGRSCELCVKVEDVDAHAAYANISGVCLAYCELTRSGVVEKTNIAAAFTAGDSDFLRVGRHGVFYDRKGQDWNAAIVRVTDHPISIRQAFWSPYKKLLKFVGEQLQKFASSRANVVQEKMVKTVLAGNAPPAPAGAPAKPAFDVAKFAGIFAAIGLAIAAIGGIFASLISGLIGLKLWQLPLVVAGLMLAVSGPSMLLAWLKLKRRNLAPILDACGWAINAKAFINIPFGASLTALPSFPEGAKRSLADPYADKKSLWPYLVSTLLMLAALGWLGYVAHSAQ